MARRSFAPGVSLVIMWVAGCAGSALRAPWTAVDHEHAAAEHLGAADKEAELFDPDQRPSLPCPGIGLFAGNGCIRRTTNPTAVHLDLAAAEKRRADQHRVAATTLVDAEDEVCRGLSREERDLGPLVLWSRPFSAQPLIDYSGAGVFHGVVIDFPGGPPDADQMQAFVACHRAHVVGRGVTTPGHECALDDTSLAVLVLATPRGTLLELRADDAEAGGKAWERARHAASASHSRGARSSPP